MKTIREKIEDRCWYWICYASDLKEKDKEGYAKIMADDLEALFREEVESDINL